MCWLSQMWSCLSGSAGSRWLALEVRLTPVWTVSRSGENLRVLPWLFMFHVEQETLNICLSVPAVPLNTHWQTCRSVCRCLLMLRVQVHDRGRRASTSTRAAAESPRPEHEIQQHRCLQPLWSHGRNWEIRSLFAHQTSYKVSDGIRTLLCYIQYTHMQADTHAFILLTCFVVALLCSALVVEKQPVMLSLPHRPLILKTGVRFSVTVR